MFMTNCLHILVSFDTSQLWEEAYEALKTFEILGIQKKLNIGASTCPSVVDTLGSSSSSLKDLFYAMNVNMLLKCEINEDGFAGVAS
ncbi:hypothetical protein U1Q18_028332 [Sarracenia purpurea var. burkii]